MPIPPNALNSTHVQPATGRLPHNDLEHATVDLNTALHAKAVWLDNELNRGLELALRGAGSTNIIEAQLCDDEDRLEACEHALASHVDSAAPHDLERKLQLQADWFLAKQVVMSRNLAFERAHDQLDVVTRFLNGACAQADALFDPHIDALLQQALRVASDLNLREDHAPQEPLASHVLALEPKESQAPAPDMVVCEPVGVQQDACLYPDHQAF